jgi:hypothetical protein
MGPRQQELDRGTLRAIVRQADPSVDECHVPLGELAQSTLQVLGQLRLERKLTAIGRVLQD